MKKRENQAPANTSGGNHTEKQKRKLRPVYLTEYRWEALKATGNASHEVNRILSEAGISE